MRRKGFVLEDGEEGAAIRKPAPALKFGVAGDMAAEQPHVRKLAMKERLHDFVRDCIGHPNGEEAFHPEYLSQSGIFF